MSAFARLLSAVLLALAPAAAQAQLDLESIEFERRVDRVAAGALEESAAFSVIVRGEGITQARLQRPDEQFENLSEDPAGVWSVSFAFGDEDALDVDFPGASDAYLLELNGGALEVEIDYEMPALPEFAITSPVHDSENNSPSTTPFQFTACPAEACSDDDDHVRALVLRGANVEAGGIVADPAAGSWVPEDEDGVPVVLPQDANLVFGAQLRAERRHFRVAGGGDFYTFWNRFYRADEVDFSTGFRGLDEAPVGAFAIEGDDPADAILVTSGPVETTLAGVSLAFDYALTPKGKVTGMGSADVDDDGGFETPIEVKGKLKGKDGEISQKLSVKIKNKEPGSEASAKYAREEVFDLGGGSSARSEALKGKVLGVKVEAAAAGSDPIPGESGPWTLAFSLSTIDGLKVIVSDASLTIGERVIDLQGGGKYDSAAGRTQLSLKSGGDDKGVSVRVNRLEVDEEGNVTGALVLLKAFGQKVEHELP